MASRWVKALYAVLFVAVLPVLLVAWAAAAAPSVPLPVFRSPSFGCLAAALGLLLTTLGVTTLWIHGGGPPMNVAPPPRHVAHGIYRLLAHPIYAGFSLLCIGVAIATGSASGLWLVSPTVILGATALVLGFERHDLRARFGEVPPRAIRIAVAGTDPPALGERVAAYTHVLAPWLLIYGAIAWLGPAPDARSARMSFEAAWPVLPWTELAYASVYAGAALAPIVAKSRDDLRRFSMHGLLAMAFVFPMYLVVPLTAPPISFEGAGLFAAMLRAERALDTPAASFPSFHVIWAWLVARVLAARWPRARHAWYGWAFIVVASCITTGMHALVDVLAAFVVLALLPRAGSVWSVLRSMAERIANSWREWDLGPVRFINHGGWAALGSFVAVSMVGILTGGKIAAALVAALAGLVGAALWAQIIEGSPRLLRPYGYYGGLIGACAGSLFGPFLGAPVWLVLGAFAVAGPFVQAAGRLRCLVQGCCHGSACSEYIGIRYFHPRSRVCRLSDLGGKPVHPTQLYSILWNGVIALATARLWSLHAPLHLIGGVYLILNGAGRFVEECYRGEPQTPIYAKLRLYQWVAVASLLIGAAVTALGTGGPAPTPALHAPSLLAGLGFGIVTWFALGVDFPRSNARFSRLV